MKKFEEFVNERVGIIIISEKFLNNEISEKEFENYFFKLNENFIDLKSKLLDWIGWFVNNIEKLGGKLNKYLQMVISTIIKPLFKFKKTFATLALTLILSVSSLNVIGGNDNDKVVVKDNIKASMGLLTKVYAESENDQEASEIMKLSREVMRLADDNITNDTISSEFKETFAKMQRMIDRYNDHDPSTYDLLVQQGEKIINELNKKPVEKNIISDETKPDTGKVLDIKGNPNLGEYSPEIQKIIKKILKEKGIKSDFIIGVGTSSNFNIAQSKAKSNVLYQINSQTGEKVEQGGRTVVKGTVRLVDYNYMEEYNRLSDGSDCFVYVVQNK